ncbi:MAG: hypothetical protein JXD23_03060 [Spirochaetales bacterium]|nr:hypothetical protein [Spirochaetales bacterium]
MNNDQVKALLVRLKPDVEDFTVILSGKGSKKVNGLYKPLDRSIILHNKNFRSDNELVFTAIHEFAHHLQFTETAKPITARVHTARFYDIFHTLLFQAEKAGIYDNVFTTNEDFIALTERIRDEFIAPHGRLIQAFGEILLTAHELCDKHHADFGDYVDRVLKLKHSSALSLVKLSNLKLNPDLGYENMKTLARIPDPVARKRAEKDLTGAFSPSMIEKKYVSKQESPDPVTALTAEKKRLERTIDSLRERLETVKLKLKEIEAKPRSAAADAPSGDGLLKRNQP